MPVLMPISQEISLTPQEQFDLIARYPDEDPELSYTGYAPKEYNVPWGFQHCAKPDRIINVLRGCRKHWKRDYGIDVPIKKIELVCTGFWHKWGEIWQCCGNPDDGLDDIAFYNNTPEFPLPAFTLLDQLQKNPKQFAPYVLDKEYTGML
jgi:hypothetical protein